MKKKFFSLLQYSFGNEDWRTEEEALNIQPQDHVLCITASGDRPLNLLVRSCQKMVCIDANPVQNHLLELKIAAMQALDFQDYLAFLGATNGKKRKKTLDLVLPYMNSKAALFWKKHQRMVDKGILYQGSVERLTKIVALFFSLTKKKKVERLFSMDDIEEQRKFLKEEWNTFVLRKMLNLVLNTFLSRMIIRDPGIVNFSCDMKPGAYVYNRMHETLQRDLAKTSPLLSLFFRGKVSPEGFSPYLTEKGAQAIKKRIPSVEIHTTDVLNYLESIPGPAFDAFSLSDVASYLSYPDFIRLLKNIKRTAKPGARFCLRQLLSTYKIPENLQTHFVRDTALEQKLDQLDNCFVYRFMTGSIA